MSVEDRFYDYNIGGRLEVLLNGSVRDKVISYDMPGRSITRYCTNERGDIILDRDRDEARRETLTGDVLVRFKA